MAPALPWIPGNGVAGRVLVCGAEVDAALAGRRAATAAALLHDGPTALRLIAITRVGPGDRVLVVGSSGGLGIALIQLARARGAHVAQRSAAAPASSPGSKHSAPTRRSTPSATAGWRPHASPSAGRQR
jgi:NADPH:quinone reductase-like Zn-dependent oxidoreductase